MLDHSVATSVTFSEEAPFHVSGCVTVRVTLALSPFANPWVPLHDAKVRVRCVTVANVNIWPI